MEEFIFETNSATEKTKADYLRELVAAAVHLQLNIVEESDPYSNDQKFFIDITQLNNNNMDDFIKNWSKLIKLQEDNIISSEEYIALMKKRLMQL